MSMHIPANAIYDIAPVESSEHILLLMLPGAKNTPQQLADNGFISTLREHRLPVDVLALDAHVDLYLERERVEQLLHDTLNNARAHGYRRIWLLGISLGGTGAMLCATQRTAEIEGIFLLAPFLGTRGIIAEVAAAGGLHQWQAGEIVSLDHERALLQKIQHSPLASDNFPPIFLGYGSEDRYRGASIMLSAHLPQQCIAVIPGGHDWETWGVLWQKLLGIKPFTSLPAQI